MRSSCPVPPTAPWVLIAILWSGCTPAAFTTLTIYDSPQAFVRLETNRAVTEGSSLAHPATLSADRLAVILQGVIVEEPLTRMPLYDDLSVPRRHRVFSQDEVELFAPLLSLALARATPEEVVTFYRTQRLSAVRREVTSGGLYVQGEDLHFLLSNNRSDTHYVADLGMADTPDDRLTPLRAIAPQKGTLHFEPAEAHRTDGPRGLARLFHWDRRELIIRLDRIPDTLTTGTTR